MKNKILLIAAGIFLAFLFLEISLRAAGYIGRNVFLPHYDYSSVQKNEKVIFCLGDSFTYGIGAGFENSYPVILEKMLNAQSENNDRYRVFNLGVPGYDSGQTAEMFRRTLKKISPDMVILLSGMNDGWKFAEQERIDEACWQAEAGYSGSVLRIKKLAFILLWNLKAKFNQSAVQRKPAGASSDQAAGPVLAQLRAAKLAGDFKKAEALIPDLLRLSGRDKEILAEIDDLLIREGRPEHAAGIYRELYDGYPQNEYFREKLAQAYENLAGEAYLDHQPEKAKKFYLAALALSESRKKSNLRMLKNIFIYEKRMKGLREIAQICRKRKIPLLLSGYPEFTQLCMFRLSREYGLPLVEHSGNFSKAVAAGAREKYFVSDTDMHCRRAGYELMARDFFDAIRGHPQPDTSVR